MPRTRNKKRRLSETENHVKGNVRLRRLPTLQESDLKVAADDVLFVTWEQLPLHPDLRRALQRAIHLSHATHCQALSFFALQVIGSSAVVEAHTGCGKTLGFLIPVLHRLLSYNRNYERAHDGQPYRRNQTHAVVVSPCTFLAEQSYLVAKQLTSSLPYDITPVLRTGHSEGKTKASTTKNELGQKTRGGGVILFTTPAELEKCMRCYDEHGAKTDEIFSRSHEGGEHTLLLILDEADVLLEDKQRMSDILRNIDIFTNDGTTGTTLIDNTKHSQRIDFGLFGATCLHSNAVADFLSLRGLDMSEQNRNIFVSDRILSNQGDKPENEKCIYSISQSSNLCRNSDVNGEDPVFESLCEVVDTIFTHKLDQKDPSMPLVRILKHPPWSVIQLQNETALEARLSNRYVLFSAPTFSYDMSYLVHVLNLHPSQKHIVFCANGRRAELVGRRLQLASEHKWLAFSGAAIITFHEQLKSTVRQERYLNFLNHEVHVSARFNRVNLFPTTDAKHGAVLVTTDLAAHGLDIRDVSYVIHFDIPTSAKSYAHRVGRVARMGLSGTNIVMLSHGRVGYTSNESNNIRTLDACKNLVEDMRKVIEICPWELKDVMQFDFRDTETKISNK